MRRSCGSNFLFTESIQENAMITDIVRDRLDGGKGLEIGGPSQAFSSDGICPIYPLLSELHDLSFPRPPEWGGRSLDVRAKFDGVRQLSHQFIGDAELGDALPDDRYRCIVSSHVIEHLTNPLRTLRLRAGLLDEQGLMVHILPHKEKTFDARRPVTRLDHLIADDDSQVDHTDTTHYAEVRKFSNEEHSDQWFVDVPKHRGMHQHVFDTKLCIEMFAYIDMRIYFSPPVLPHHIVVAVQPQSGVIGGQNVNGVRSILVSSPFVPDRANASSPGVEEIS
jgi:hypothetical protein